METFSALLVLCAGNSPVTGELAAQRPVTRSFDVFFHLRLNKRLNKQSWGWWFETLSCSLWRHSNDFRWYIRQSWSPNQSIVAVTIFHYVGQYTGDLLCNLISAVNSQVLYMSISGMVSGKPIIEIYEANEIKSRIYPQTVEYTLIVSHK